METKIKEVGNSGGIGTMLRFTLTHMCVVDRACIVDRACDVIRQELAGCFVISFFLEHHCSLVKRQEW